MIDILKRTSKKERGIAAISMVFIIVQVWLELKIPDYMSEITTLLQTEGTTTQEIIHPGIWMIGLSLLSFLASIVVGFFAAKIAASLSTRLRDQIYSKIMHFSQSEIQQFSIPSLITRTTNDLTQIQLVVAMGLQVVIKGPITAVWAITKIANKNWQWTLTTAIAVLFLLIMLSTLLLLVQPKFTKVQNLTDKLNSITRENLSGIRVIRAYNAENIQSQKFEQANENLTTVNLFTNRMLAIMNPGMTIISSGLTLAVYWIGAYLIDAAQLDAKLGLFSDMVVFTSYAMQVVLGFMLMTIIFLILPRALVSAKRITEVLETNLSLVWPEQSVLTEKRGEIEFDHVSFGYDKNAVPVIQDISFKAKQGQTIAFIGSTGSGKSTLINLIPRFYDATSGEVKIDGQNVQAYAQDELNNRIGFIPQKPVLFSGTIRSNLDFGTSEGSPLSDDDLKQALTIAQAWDFVEAKSQKLDDPVAQGGSNFSGGQKQRLAIARVIARKPEILIFDDSFSALDYRTDKTLRDALDTHLRQTTKLIVAQRISTIMHADQIIVLDEGQMVGIGTHETLLATNDIYQEIAYSQLSKEELAHGK